MRRLYLAASGLGLSVAVSLAMANPPVASEGDPAPFSVVQADPSAVAESPADDEKLADPEAVLREQYLKLMEEKAELMDQAELEAALSIAQQDIRELEAENLLAEARAIIERVANEYPNTRAAGEAAAIMNQSRAPAYYGTPAEDNSFRPL
ncbi:MAG: hypothetical protein JNG89_04660 [Planctomycetaceae bacterium]|nr:hypothetical protein [Planctomycetaceae bacterium]